MEHEIRLNSLDGDRGDNAAGHDTIYNDAGASHGSSLPPVDGGKDAWLFLAACFIIEALVWGKSGSRFESIIPLITCRVSLFFWCFSRVLQYA
jgi:hypothetical protein